MNRILLQITCSSAFLPLALAYEAAPTTTSSPATQASQQAREYPFFTPGETSLTRLMKLKALMEEAVLSSYTEGVGSIDMRKVQTFIDNLNDADILAMLTLYFRHVTYPNIPSPERLGIPEGDDPGGISEQWDYVCNLNSAARTTAGHCLERLITLAENGNEHARQHVAYLRQFMNRRPR